MSPQSWAFPPRVSVQGIPIALPAVHQRDRKFIHASCHLRQLPQMSSCPPFGRSWLSCRKDIGDRLKSKEHAHHYSCYHYWEGLDYHHYTQASGARMHSRRAHAQAWQAGAWFLALRTKECQLEAVYSCMTDEKRFKNATPTITTATATDDVNCSFCCSSSFSCACWSCHCDDHHDDEHDDDD